MHASLARWAVVTFCLAGLIGCAGSRPAWWPGKPKYSQSSQNAPQLPAYSQQGGVYDNQAANSQYPAPAYPPQGAAQAAPTGYGQAQAGGYTAAQDPYNQAGNVAANGQAGYDQYGQPSGAAADPYGSANPYAAAGQGYSDPAAAQQSYGQQNYGQQNYAGQSGYGAQGGGYQQPASYPGGAAGGTNYTADQRAGGGYGSDSRYDTGGYGAPDASQYNSGAQGAGQGAGWGAASGASGAAPANANWPQSGGAGYGQPATGGYGQPAASQYQGAGNPYGDATTAQQDSQYLPGSTRAYGSPSTGASTGGLSQASSATGGAAAGYTQARYPSTGASSGLSGGSTAASSDRYGRGTSALNPDVNTPAMR